MQQKSCRSAIYIKLQSNFIDITLRHGRSPVNLPHIFKTPFPRNLLPKVLNAPLEVVVDKNTLEPLTSSKYLHNGKNW